MAAASRGAVRGPVPAIPPRNLPPPIPRRLNDPVRTSPKGSPGESPSRCDPGDRRSLDVTSVNVPPAHVRRRSDGIAGRSSAQPENSIYSCLVHAGNQCTIVCTTCIEVLCNACILPENNRHTSCSLIYIGDSSSAMCDQVKCSLKRKMDSTKACVSDLSGTLTRKKDRMIAKKEETVSEVERFYRRLRAKLLAKLQREENELLLYLQTTVAAQDSSLSDKIQQCSKIVHDLQQKGAMMDNLDKLYNTSNNAEAYLKSLLGTAVDVNKDSDNVNEIIAARDAFLVIRFIVNPETEQTMINTKVASVEVLDSRVSSPDADSIEAEHINEANNNTGAESSGSVESIPLIDNTDGEINIRAPTDQEGGCSATSVPEESTEDQATGSPSTTSSRPASAVSESRSGDVYTSGSSSDTDEDPPPPYPGLPDYIRSHTPRSETPPPPYPGPPPPMYVQLPEPQQQQSQPPPQATERSRGGRSRLHSDERPSHARQTPPRPLSTGPLSSRPLSPGPLSPSSPDLQFPQVSPVSIPIPRPASPTHNSTPSVTRPRGPLKSFSVNEISDKRSSGIFSMAVYNDNSFLVIDRWNRKLKYFTDQGQSLGGVIFREEPWDITKMTEDVFAVTVPKLCNIYKLKANADSVLTVGNISTLKKYACIAYNNSMFICGQVPQFGEPSVDVIGENGGPVIFSFRTDTMGQDLFSYPRYVKVTGDGTVVVCDWNLKCLLMFKLDGNGVGRYKGAQEFVLKEPTGIELDRDENKLYVIDSKQSSSSGAVQKVSLECQCEEVFRGQNDFRDARAIAVYGNARMAVGSKNGLLSIFSTRARYR